MGLLNVYKIQEMRPFINYRFKCNIWPYNGTFALPDANSNHNYFEYNIKKIKQPVFNISSDNKKSFGNTAYVIPTFNFADTSLDITFEETNDMSVYELLTGFFNNNAFDGAKMRLICIKVDQFDETMTKLVDSKIYLCRLKEYSEPAFNNNGRGAPIELNASFNVVYIYDGGETDAGFEINYDNIIERNEIDDDYDSISQNIIDRWEEVKNRDEEDILKRKDYIKAAQTENKKQYKAIAAENYRAIKEQEIVNNITSAETNLNNYFHELLNNATDKSSYSQMDIRENLKAKFEDILTDKTISVEEKDFIVSIMKKNKVNENKQKGVLNFIDEYNKENQRLKDIQEFRNNKDLDKLLIQNYGEDAKKYIYENTNDLYNEAQNNLRKNIKSSPGNGSNQFSMDDYDKYKGLTVDQFAKRESNGWCAANTATSISLYLDLDNRIAGANMGKNMVSSNIINQINVTGKGEAKEVNYKINSIADLENLKTKYDKGDTMLVVSIDFSNMSEKTRQEVLAGHSSRNRSLKNGHAVAISNGNINQRQNTIVTYNWVTDEMIKNGEVTYKFMEIKKK